jgi:hypothetical protein
MKKLALSIFIVAVTAGVGISYATGSVGSWTPSWLSFNFGGVRGSGVIKTETRDVPKFTSIDIGGAADLEVTAQKSQNVEIETDDNLLPLITTEVKNGTLYISNTEKISWNRGGLKVRISVDQLNGLDLSGASKANVTGIRSDSFKLKASGASKVTLAGEASALDIDTSGASVVSAENLKSAKADVDASGACKVSVFATENIDADASGASRITYSGSPKSVNKKSSGASSVSGN